MIARILFLVFIFLPIMVAIVPLQFVITRLNLPFWHALPRLFHKLACVFLGLKVKTLGLPTNGRPTLLVANHISWTDVFAIGSVADLTFVSKHEVGEWFLVGFIASLQRTIYVDSSRRTDAKRVSDEMASRMAENGSVLLFAEGRSDIGTHVLPFRSALVGAAQAAMLQAGALNVAIQPLTIAYTRLQGLPVSRNERSLITWIKTKSMGRNIIDILTGCSKEVVVAFGEPVLLSAGGNRKRLTKDAEEEVRRTLVALNRGKTLAVRA